MRLIIRPIIAIVFPFFTLLIFEYTLEFCLYIFSDFLASIYEINAKTIVIPQNQNSVQLNNANV